MEEEVDSFRSGHSLRIDCHLLRRYLGPPKHQLRLPAHLLNQVFGSIGPESDGGTDWDSRHTVLQEAPFSFHGQLPGDAQQKINAMKRLGPGEWNADELVSTPQTT